MLIWLFTLVTLNFIGTSFGIAFLKLRHSSNSATYTEFLSDSVCSTNIRSKCGEFCCNYLEQKVKFISLLTYLHYKAHIV